MSKLPNSLTPKLLSNSLKLLLNSLNKIYKRLNNCNKLAEGADYHPKILFLQGFSIFELNFWYIICI